MAIRTPDVIRLSSSVKLVEPEAVKALEQAWQRRRRELASWRPSGGWLLEQRAQATRSPHST
jgi:hypothetical protein